MRRKRPIDRNENIERDASLIVIASEDQYAVKQYFEFFHSTRIQFRVLETTDGSSSPEHVMSRINDYIREYSFGEGDEFWLVCDTDHWIQSNHISNLVDVIRRCRQKGISVALSNPCFDLWLLLHFDTFPTTYDLSCNAMGAGIRAAVGSYNKTRVFDLPLTIEAVRRAIQNSRENFDANADIPESAQTAIHMIVEQLVDRGVITIPS